MNHQTQSIEERIQNLRKNSPLPPSTIERSIEKAEKKKVYLSNQKKWDMKEASAQLDIGFKELFTILRNTGDFIKCGKSNLPKSELIEKGFFTNELKTFKRGEVGTQYAKTFVTSSGMSFLNEVVKQYKSEVSKESK